MKRLSLLVFALLTLTACDRLGLPDPAKEAEQKDAEGKAIGASCRHSGRALEDCFSLNPSALKASVFAGWRDMNDYMLQNKIEVVKPELLNGMLLGSKTRAGKAGEDGDAEEGDSAESAPASESAPAEKPSRTRRSRAAVSR